MTAPTWDDLRTATRELAHFDAIHALLEWDQQVMMPPAGGAARASQIGLIARLRHARLVEPALGDLLDRLGDVDLPGPQAAAVANLRRDRDRAVRVPPDLVAALSEAQAHGFQAWLHAKEHDDFVGFHPALARLLALKREEASAIDSARHPYDVLVEGFDPGTTLAMLRPLFDRLARGLRPLVEAAADLPGPTPLPAGPFPRDAQERLHREVIGAIGFDPAAGRLDASEHPFTVGLAAGDTRITTHLYEHDLLTGLGGTLHEAGHGLYEQGLPKDQAPGTTLDAAAGLGLHESQSRFWENHIGRSHAFMRWLAPRVARHLGVELAPDALYAAANPIRPSLIRIFADEVTYDLHIIARFELEVALVDGSLDVADLPTAWSEAYARLLGIRPPDDRQGCLQDVHWATGAIGYFPSYTLGNLYAASLHAGLRGAVPDLDDRVAAGDFAPILAWLRSAIHHRGQARTAPQLVADAVGPRDGVADLLAHLYARHGALYGIRAPA